MFQNSRCASLKLLTFLILLQVRYLGFISRDHFMERYWCFIIVIIAPHFFLSQLESVLVLLVRKYDIQEPHLTEVFDWSE